MSHPAQRRFCEMVKRKFPAHFRRSNIVDIGSLDINGSNRGLFRNCNYTGIDVYPGRNVDIVGPAHIELPSVTESLRRSFEQHYRGWLEYPAPMIDTIISTEAMEHDIHLDKTLKAAYNHLRPGGLLLITAAGDGRAEHGTSDHRPEDSPGTTDYYKNVSNEMFIQVLPPQLFSHYHIAQVNTDFQFYGIKLDPSVVPVEHSKHKLFRMRTILLIILVLILLIAFL